MSTKADQLGHQAKEVTEHLQKLGGTVRDAAEVRIEQVGERAAEYCEQGRDKVHGVACACEQFLHERPLTSVLVAIGVGWLLGRFWIRR